MRPRTTLVTRQAVAAHVQDNIRMVSKRRCNSSANNMGSQLKKLMFNMLIKHMQVAEEHSPPRAVETATNMGIRGGWGFDLTTNGGDGFPWGFNDAMMRNRVVRKLLQDKPHVPIGSPMCTAYSAMNRINYSKMSTKEVAQRMAHARRQVDFCIKLCEIQWRNERYLLHEHPDGASSWEETIMKRLMIREGCNALWAISANMT